MNNTFQPKRPTIAKPFLKWAGGKAQILNNIKMMYPALLGKEIVKYAEPFVGAGAVLFDIVSRFDISDVYISDTNRELIQAYITIRDDRDNLFYLLKSLEDEYLRAGETDRKRIYYANRRRFNALKIKLSKKQSMILSKPGEETTELAALFIFLNKTCFNGLYRVNAKGEFNVPQGRYKNPRIFDESNLKEVSGKLQNVRIVCGDYKKSESFIDEKTLAYFDPPYRPLTSSSYFTAYTEDGFGDKEQIELARFIDNISARGAYVIASNSDPSSVNEGDSFIHELYSNHKIFRINASRAINSNKDKRGKINELLILSY